MGRGPTVKLDAPEFLLFHSAKEGNNDVNSFLNLRFITRQKPALFLRKYYMITSSKLRRFHWMYLTFCRKYYLAELEKSPSNLRHSLLFLRYFKKLKNTWFLHVYRYLKNCNEFLRLIYLHMSLQNP